MKHSQEQPEPAQWQPFEEQQQQAVTTAAVLAAGAIATSLAGAGMSYYSSQQQAKNSERIGAYNAAVQRQQAELQTRMQQRQALSAQTAIQTQQNQTQAIDNEAVQRTREAQAQIQRQQEEKRRALATTRASYAKAGVVMSGTPLAQLAETAGLFELQNQDAQYKADLENRALTRRGELARAGLLDDAYTQDLNYRAAAAGKRIALDQAQITEASGRATAQGYRMEGYGSLLSGAASAGDRFSTAYDKGAFKSKKIKP
jgi:hypothetical protein